MTATELGLFLLDDDVSAAAAITPTATEVAAWVKQ
jgi:hypothetical protein